MLRKLFFVIGIFTWITAFSQENRKISHAPEFIDLFASENNDEVACYRIPALITAPNGDLVAAIDVRIPSCADLRGNGNINIVIRRSTDNGTTWTATKRIVDFPEGQSASDPSMIVDKITGEIFMFYNFMDLKKEKDVYYFHAIKSKDNGKSWSKPVDITPQITKPEWQNDFKFITSGRGVQTKSGKLLHCLVNLNVGLHVFGSDDHGKTWYLIDTPIKPGDESKIVELADGTWMINSRVNGEGKRFVHISKDEGNSWETKAAPQLADPGCNASIIRYTSASGGYVKNRLIFANAKSNSERVNLSVRISYDEGQTWTKGKTIYEGSSAYSSLTILKNGDIGLLFEKDDYSKNAFVRFSLNWLTGGKDSVRRTSN